MTLAGYMKLTTSGQNRFSDVSDLRGGSEARSCPQISPKWLQFQFGMIRMDQWDVWDRPDM